ncbi:VanZ family protein [Paenibacillus sp. IB182496]|uniref:VanZ family protein n=1 Tax=Paenibacillus sabuli TaxID=2772509 RepID=A0A927BXI4_9BACL|nr:VanZ family protein [Paenibacillus sabuli]MBD2847550.1 VanZ family protein [Paenibacillus sabuli]
MRTSLKWLLVVLAMGLIFMLSHQPASTSRELSDGFSRAIASVLGWVAPDASWDTRSLNHIVRKNAHFFIYLGMGFVAMLALRSLRIRLWRSAGLALLLCVLYAVADEVHQMFVPGRGAQVRDVLIDSAGASLGVGLYALGSRLRRRRGPKDAPDSGNR